MAAAPWLLSTRAGQPGAVVPIKAAQFFSAALRYFLQHHGADGLLIAVGAVLAASLVRTARSLHQLKQTLESRIAQREELLAENYARLTVLERHEAAADERKRIMRDLHDGLGSRMFTCLSRVERGAMDRMQMAAALRACIADMRLALDALAPDLPDLYNALGDFLFRWQTEFDAVAIACVWQVEIAADQVHLSPHATLQVLRVAQEALTNVARHASATRVDLSVSCRDGTLQMVISDNGIGVGTATAASAAGRGLHNMRARSVQLGGTLRIETGDGQGTRIMLTVPRASACH